MISCMIGSGPEQMYALLPRILTFARLACQGREGQEMQASTTAGAELRDWTASFARRTRTLGGGEITAIRALAGATHVITFSGGFPDPATFPKDVLAEIAGRLVAQDVAVALQYSQTEGLPSLRDYLAGRLDALQGRRPGAGELMVTSGGIDCMELVAKSLVDPGDPVVVEAPSYLGAIMAFRGYEGDLRGVPMDEDGMQVDVLADLLDAGLRPKVLYTIPDHQNPTGLSLAAERRPALVELARRYRFLILEDVAYRRLGWAAAPPEVIAQLVTAKQNSDQCSGALGQRMLEEYGRGGHLDRQLVESRALYARRAELMGKALAEHMPEGTGWTTPRGGFFTWVTAPDGIDAVALSPAASTRKVAYVPGRPFYPGDGGVSQLRLAYSRVEDDLIDEGARRLGDVFRTALQEA